MFSENLWEQDVARITAARPQKRAILFITVTKIPLFP
jgi:hypothetical protein